MDLKKECFLVTGAAGFVGACLTRRLAGLGLNVHALVPVAGDLWRLKDILPSLSLHRGDINDDIFVRSLIQKVQPTIIYHLAAHGGYPTQTDTRRILMTNVMGTWNLLEALDKTPYKLFVNTGSSSEYGFKHNLMTESDILEPNSYYAVAKAAQTMLCQYTCRVQKKPIVTFRLFSVYGPYEEPVRLVPTLIRRCLEGQALDMVDPKTVRDFVFVEDVVDAYLAIDQLVKNGGENFNIGSGIQTTMEEMVTKVTAMTQAKVEVRWNTMPARIWDSSLWVADAAKSREMLKWQAKTSLEDGLHQTMTWFKKQ